MASPPRSFSPESRRRGHLQYRRLGHAAAGAPRAPGSRATPGAPRALGAARLAAEASAPRAAEPTGWEPFDEPGEGDGSRIWSPRRHRDAVKQHGGTNPVEAMTPLVRKLVPLALLLHGLGMTGGAVWLAVPKGRHQGFGDSWLLARAGRTVQSVVAVLLWGTSGVAFVAAAYAFWSSAPWLDSANPVRCAGHAARRSAVGRLGARRGLCRAAFAAAMLAAVLLGGV